MDVETVRHYGFLGVFITEAMFIIALLRATIFVICKCNAIGVAIFLSLLLLHYTRNIPTYTYRCVLQHTFELVRSQFEWVWAVVRMQVQWGLDFDARTLNFFSMYPDFHSVVLISNVHSKKHFRVSADSNPLLSGVEIKIISQTNRPSRLFNTCIVWN